MKKFLIILAAGILWCNVGYTETNSIYLICKNKVTKSNNKGLMAMYIPEGKIVNAHYIFIKKNGTKLKMEFYGHEAGLGWKDEKPFILYQESDEVKEAKFKDGHYKFYHDDGVDGKYYKNTFDIFETEGKWSVKGTEKFDAGDPAYYIDYEFLGVCNEYKKKEFLKLRKKGVK